MTVIALALLFSITELPRKMEPVMSTGRIRKGEKCLNEKTFVFCSSDYDEVLGTCAALKLLQPYPSVISLFVGYVATDHTFSSK